MIVNTMSWGVPHGYFGELIYYAKNEPKLIQVFSLFTFTDVFVEVDSVDFTLTSGLTSAAREAAMHSKLHRVLKKRKAEIKLTRVYSN